VESEVPTEAQEVERSMTAAPTHLARPAGRIARGLDAFAYALAVMSIFPAGAALLLWALVISGYGAQGPPNLFQTGRRTIFEFFRSPVWPWFLGVSVASAFLAGIAIAISRRRRATSRLAAAAVRLASLGLALAGLEASILGALAAYRFLW